MNTSYLKDMFSDDKFVECFEEVSEIILGDFKEENDSKLNAII